MRKKLLIIAGILLVLFFIVDYFTSFRTSDASAIADFSKAGIHLSVHTTEIRGRHLHYVSVGNDSLATILFVHGSPGGWDNFEGYLKDTALGAKFRLISIDRPGFGYSDYRQALNMQQQSDIIAVLLRQLQNGKPLYLVGHSYGGPLIANLAAEHPELIQGIVELAGALDPAMEPKESWRPVMLKWPLCYLMPGAFKPSNEELWYLKKELGPLKEKLSSIRCAVYVMHGQKDMLVDVRNVDFMKKEMVNASSFHETIFPNENHFIPWTQRDAVTGLLMQLKEAK